MEPNYVKIHSPPPHQLILIYTSHI